MTVLAAAILNTSAIAARRQVGPKRSAQDLVADTLTTATILGVELVEVCINRTARISITKGSDDHLISTVVSGLLMGARSAPIIFVTVDPSDPPRDIVDPNGCNS